MPELPLNNEPTRPVVKNADDILDLLKDDSEEIIPEKKETKNKEEKELKEEKDDDNENLELVEEDEDDGEKLDLESKDDDKIEINAPPRKKEILAKYPDLFKTFPFMEKMLYRDRQYTELFGSFDDAKEIAEKAEVFSEFEGQLLSGNTEDILKNVKESDPKAFDKIVDGYLKTLAKVDKDAYLEVTGNLVRQVIVELVKEGNESQNDELKQAALILNQFMGWGNKLTAPKQRVENDKNAEHSEAEKERISFLRERFETSVNDLQTKSDNILKNTLNEYMDPKDLMSGFVKKNAVNEALNLISKSMAGDASFQANLDRLWKAASAAKFSQDSLKKIQSFYLGRAKNLLPLAIRKVRAEALKDLPPKQRVEEEKEETTPQRRGTLAPGRPSQPKKNEMKRGESVAEFFARD